MENKFQKCIHNICINSENCRCLLNKFKRISDQDEVTFNKKFRPEMTEGVNFSENTLIGFSDDCFRQRELDLVLSVDELFKKWDEKDIMEEDEVEDNDNGQMPNHVNDDESQSDTQSVIDVEQMSDGEETDIEFVNDLEEEGQNNLLPFAGERVQWKNLRYAPNGVNIVFSQYNMQILLNRLSVRENK